MRKPSQHLFIEHIEAPTPKMDFERLSAICLMLLVFIGGALAVYAALDIASLFWPEMYGGGQ